MAKSAHITNPSQSHKCVDDGCNQKVIARGLCRRHYYMRKRHGVALPATKKRMKLPCSVSRCRSNAFARGYCGKHYQRLRIYGRLELKRSENGKGVKFLTALVGHKGKACIDWPFGKTTNGYGSIHFKGTTMTAARAMCIIAHGEPPFANAEACHGCGRRVCVNPNCLRWDTYAGNSADQLLHGTRLLGEAKPSAKLTAEAVRYIRLSNDTDANLARQFNCACSTIQKARKRLTWTHI